MCVGGEGVRAAEETGQGSSFSYLACILYQGEETSVGRAAPAPQQPEDSAGRSGRLCSARFCCAAEIPAAGMWGQALCSERSQR